jgi:hypothetical protein
MVETENGMMPITWAPPEDTFYEHKLEGDPETAKRFQGKYWDAPSNKQFRENEGDNEK